MKKKTTWIWICHFIVAVANIIGIAIEIIHNNLGSAGWAIIALFWQINFMIEALSNGDKKTKTYE